MSAIYHCVIKLKDIHITYEERERERDIYIF